MWAWATASKVFFANPEKVPIFAVPFFGTYTGEMLEWLKRHAWKACVPQKGIARSNLALSAKGLPIGSPFALERDEISQRYPLPKPLSSGEGLAVRRRRFANARAI